jgi:hypothetical protein
VEPLVTLLATTLIGTGIALWRMPVGECAQCVHCAARKLAHQRETEAQTSRAYGIPFCPSCGRHHSPEEQHRH